MALPRYTGDGSEARLQGFREDVARTAEAIAAQQSTLDVLLAKRRQRLHDHVAAELPDLRPETLARVQARFPGFQAADRVHDELEAASLAYRNQLADLEPFDPAEAEASICRLEVRLPVVEAERSLAQEAFDSLDQIPDVRRLVEAGYDTGSYRPHFFQAQYHLDWRAADKAIAQAGTKTWRALLGQYAIHWRAAANAHEEVRAITSDLESLRAKVRRFRELMACLDQEVPERVLALARAQFQGFLEAADDPSPFADIVSLDVRIGRCQDEIFALEEARAKALAALFALEQAKAKYLRYKERLAAAGEVCALMSEPSVADDPSFDPSLPPSPGMFPGEDLNEGATSRDRGGNR